MILAVNIRSSGSYAAIRRPDICSKSWQLDESKSHYMGLTHFWLWLTCLIKWTRRKTVINWENIIWINTTDWSSSLHEIKELLLYEKITFHIIAFQHWFIWVWPLYFFIRLCLTMSSRVLDIGKYKKSIPYLLLFIVLISVHLLMSRTLLFIVQQRRIKRYSSIPWWINFLYSPWTYYFSPFYFTSSI